jgi:hypothetical protein
LRPRPVWLLQARQLMLNRPALNAEQQQWERGVERCVGGKRLLVTQLPCHTVHCGSKCWQQGLASHRACSSSHHCLLKARQGQWSRARSRRQLLAQCFHAMLCREGLVW